MQNVRSVLVSVMSSPLSPYVIVFVMASLSIAPLLVLELMSCNNKVSIRRSEDLLRLILI